MSKSTIKNAVCAYIEGGEVRLCYENDPKAEYRLLIFAQSGKRILVDDNLKMLTQSSVALKGKGSQKEIEAYDKLKSQVEAFAEKSPSIETSTGAKAKSDVIEKTKAEAKEIHEANSKASPKTDADKAEAKAKKEAEAKAKAEADAMNS